MNRFSIEFFTATTGEDQRDYFFGDAQPETPAFSGRCETLAPGIYRIVNGSLCRIVGVGTDPSIGRRPGMRDEAPLTVTHR